MNEINFLPRSFYQARSRHRRIWIETTIVCALACTLAVVHALRGHGLQELRDRALEVETQASSAQRSIKEATALQNEYRELASQLSVQRQLALPIGYTQILAMISKVTPDSIAFTDLRIESPRPVPVAAEDEKKSGKSRRSAKAAVVKEKAVEPLRIMLTGLSPDDARIADLVGRLADSPVFRDVKLEYSRSTQHGTLLGRSFRVTMQVPLDRTYRAPVNREGVADAN